MLQVGRHFAFCFALACLSTSLARGDESSPEPLDEQALAVTFREKVEPLLKQYCQKCHSGDEPEADFAIGGFLERAALVGDRQTWQEISRKLHAHEMPPEDQPQPSTEERAKITGWIDTGLARFDCGRERDPGRVTIRRLNRNEYNNTIRDLVGIDFRPADDFPSDDVGYGFDNIGDVLSMPPILLEKYVAAAQQVVERALGTAQVNLATGEIQGGQIVDRGRILTSQLEVRTKVRTFGKGDYIVRIRAHGDQAGDEPVKMELHVNDDKVASFDVKATEDAPHVYEAWVSTRGGGQTVEITFTNDYYQPDDPRPNDRNLIIHDIEMTGPYPPTYRAIIPREHRPDDKMALAREVVGRFATRAFRRPVTDAETERLMKLVALADSAGENFASSVGLALEAILVSPHFLFRVELDPNPDDPSAVRTINDFELATRLSYFLWSTMPDDELFGLAQTGKLREGDTLRQQVERMLKDEKAQALVENFAGQWLQLRNLKIATPDPGVYPGFDEPLRIAMQKETELFFAAVVREDRSVLDFIDGSFTYLNARLAKHYGVEGIEGDDFRRVELDGEKRSGVLTHASVLTVTSNPTRTSPVKRGKWVLENLLGAPPPAPPAEVPPLAEGAEAMLTGSLRERMQQHRAKAECSVCHKRMDPLGFGLENYDGIGAWRTEDGKFAIDASGTLPGGQAFAGPRGLKEILRARQDDFVRCLAERMLTFGLGRGVEYSDQCTVTDIVKHMQQSDYKFSGLIVGIVTSDAFQKRRAKGNNP